MSTTLVDMPAPQKDLNAAGRQYVEQFGSYIVTITYLKIAVLSLSLLNLGLIALNLKTYQAFRYVKPLVIRINEIGQAVAVQYDAFAYQPQEREVRYFLSDFVERHYSRMRATVHDNYARSLYYLDGRLADALIEANKKNKTIESVLAGSGDEIDVSVKNVSIEDLRTPPYHATVEFEKIYYSAADRLPAKREKYVANLVFVVKDHVPNAMIPINPLGLTITYFREDQAFQSDRP